MATCDIVLTVCRSKRLWGMPGQPWEMKNGESCREWSYLLSASWPTEASRAGLYMHKFISSPSSLFTCLLNLPSNQAEWVVVAAAAPATLMFEEGCYIYEEKEVAAKAGKGMCRQMAVCIGTSCLCGEQHVGGCTTQSCSLQTVQVGLPLWSLKL